MMHWETWQWVSLAIPNLLTAIAYFYIPWKMWRHKTIEGESKHKNIFLLISFIVSCGFYLLLHLLFMFYDLFYWMLFIDLVMAYASIIAAKMLDF